MEASMTNQHIDLITKKQLNQKLKKMAAIKSLARELMGKHGLLDKGWKLEWDESKVYPSSCFDWIKVIRLSVPFAEVNTIETTRIIILHEIAHALTPGAHHSKVWELVAQAIGAEPKRCSDPDYGLVMPMFPWTGSCADCGKEFKRTKRPSGTYYHNDCTRVGPTKGVIKWNRTKEGTSTKV
jgi:predicted transcriptional regulator